MTRQALLGLFDRYRTDHPGEWAQVERLETLVRDREDCFERSCLPGHITASAWIVSPDRSRFLLTHHRKLRRWLQLGGHADGEPDPRRVALREAQEESGLRNFAWLLRDDEVQLVDLDIHPIPAHGAEPRHDHYDLRFVLVAMPGQALRVSDESLDLRWFPRHDFDRVVQEESLERLGRKAYAWLDQNPPQRPARVDFP